MAHGKDIGTIHGISLMGSNRISLGCVGLGSSGDGTKMSSYYFPERD